MPYIVTIVVPDIDSARRVRGAFKAEPIGVVAGVYRLPRRDQVDVCPGQAGGCRETSWMRDEWGVWVHACGGRARDWRSRIRRVLLDTFGINMLPRDQTPPLFQNPEGYDKPTEKRAPVTKTKTRPIRR